MPSKVEPHPAINPNAGAGGSAGYQNHAFSSIGESGERAKTAPEVRHAADGAGSTRPSQRQSCTDVLCAALMLVALVLEIGVLILAFFLGNPALLIYPKDSNGNLCGYDTAVADRPYLAYFDLVACARLGPAALLASCPTTIQVCVDTCPSSYWSWLSGEVIEDLHGWSASQRAKMLCKYGVNASSSNTSINNLVKRSDCAPYTVASLPVLYRCMPRAVLDVGQVLTDGLRNLTSADGTPITAQALGVASTYLSEAMRTLEPLIYDLLDSKWVVGVGLLAALLLSLLWLVLLRFFAAVIVWVLLSAFVLIFASTSAYSVYRYLLLRGYQFRLDFTAPIVQVTTTAPPATTAAALTDSNGISFNTLVAQLDYYLSQSGTWLAFAIIAGVCALLALLIVIFLRSRVVLATRLIAEASRAIGAVWSTLLWPLVPFVLLVIAIAFFTTAAVFIVSIRNENTEATFTTMAPNTSTTSENATASASTTQRGNILQQCGESHWVDDHSVSGAVRFSSCVLQSTFGTWWTVVLQLYNVFVGLWVVNFVHGLGQMVLAGAFSVYFWAGGESARLPALPLGSALFYSLFFHGGSIAFGSLLIALVQLVRIVLAYVEHKLQGANNKVALFFVKCCQCCMWCLERFLKFISKNAYILVISWSVSFCIAAKRAFELLVQNCVRVAVLNRVTDFVLLIGELLVTGAVVIVAYYFLVGSLSWFLPSSWVPTLTYFAVPLVLLGIGSFAIAVYCFSVFHMAVDTLFLCAMEDLEVNDGSPEKPYLMTCGLMNALGVKNKAPPRDGAHETSEL